MIVIYPCTTLVPADSLHDFDILVADAESISAEPDFSSEFSSCGSFSGTASESVDVICSEPLHSWHVAITITGDNEMIQLCEVEIFANTG